MIKLLSKEDTHKPKLGLLGKPTVGPRQNLRARNTEGPKDLDFGQHQQWTEDHDVGQGPNGPETNEYLVARQHSHCGPHCTEKNRISED